MAGTSTTSTANRSTCGDPQAPVRQRGKGRVGTKALEGFTYRICPTCGYSSSPSRGCGWVEGSRTERGEGVGCRLLRCQTCVIHDCSHRSSGTKSRWFVLEDSSSPRRQRDLGLWIGSCCFSGAVPPQNHGSQQLTDCIAPHGGSRQSRNLEG